MEIVGWKEGGSEVVGEGGGRGRGRGHIYDSQIRGNNYGRERKLAGR